MATTTTTRTFEYDATGKVVREVTVVETVGPYASGGIVSTITTPAPRPVDPQAVLDALLRLKAERGGKLGLS